jgi:hypothetical protein
VRRPVPPRCLQPIGESPVAELFEPAQRQGRPGHISTQTLESPSIPCRNRDVGVKTHPAHANAARRDPRPRLDAILTFFLGNRIDPIPESSPRRARLGPRRDSRADGRGAQQREQRIVLRKPVLAVLLPRRLETAPDPPRRPGQYAGHVVGLGWIERKKATRSMRRPLVDSVEHERMEVGRQIEGRTKALDERDGAAQAAPDPEVAFGAPSLVGEHSAQEAAQHLARESRVPRTSVSEWIGKREHPLPNRHFGKDVIDELGCHVRHAPTTARGTESSSLARERDETIVSACIAVDAQEPMGEHTALEIATNLALDEASDGGAHGSGAREERFEFLAHHAMEQGLF